MRGASGASENEFSGLHSCPGLQYFSHMLEDSGGNMIVMLHVNVTEVISRD